MTIQKEAAAQAPVEATPAEGAVFLNSERHVRDLVLFATVPGLEDALKAEIKTSIGQHGRTVGGGSGYLLVELEGPLSLLLSLRLSSWCGSVVISSLPTSPTDQAVESIVARLEESAADGAISALSRRDQPLQFRIDPINDWRRRLVREIGGRLGWSNAPSDWDVNLALLDGVLVAQLGPLARARRLGALERIPASTNPVIAAFMAAVLDVQPHDVVLDPFCGAGTLLLEVGVLQPNATLIGTDTSEKALTAARTNLRELHLELHIADARSIACADSSVARIVANLPFGKRVGSHKNNVTLYEEFVRELDRVLTSTGRAVLLTEEKRLLRAAVNEAKSLTVTKELVLTAGGLHPSVFVVERKRSRSGRR